MPLGLDGPQQDYIPNETVRPNKQIPVFIITFPSPTPNKSARGVNSCLKIEQKSLTAQFFFFKPTRQDAAGWFVELCIVL